MVTNATIITVHPGALPLQCCTYALKSELGIVLIDPGSGYYEHEVIAGLNANGMTEEDVNWALLTHYHVDHALGVGSWQHRGTKVMASTDTAEKLRSASSMVWNEQPDLVPAVEVDAVLEDGQRLELGGTTIECVATPGHTAGCMSFVVPTDEGRAAFTGDVLMYDFNPGWAGGKDFSADALLHSLERLRALSLTKAYPGHDTIEGDVTAWLSEGMRRGRAGLWRLTQ